MLKNNIRNKILFKNNFLKKLYDLNVELKLNKNIGKKPISKIIVYLKNIVLTHYKHAKCWRSANTYL